MPDKMIMLLYISRMLTSENQADLLGWVHKAYSAECSVKKTLDIDVTAEKFPPQKTQE